MSENEQELKAVMDAVNRRVEVVVPEGFAVMVNGVQMAPVLGTEQNPATNRAQLPDGTGLVVMTNGTKEWYKNGEYMTEAEFLVATQKSGKNDPEGTANTTDSAITSDKFPLGSEQNPAKNRAELPDGTGIMVNGRGTKFWYKNGEYHREDGPAVEGTDGSKFWYLNGEKLSEAEFLKAIQKNGKNDPEGTAKDADSSITADEFPVGSEQNPAKDSDELPNGTGLVVMTNGTKFWYKNGELHREDGPAVERKDREKCWYLNGELHREDGPALEYSNGDKEWYKNGERHREDGPAIEWANGSKFWYLNGKVVRG